MWHILPMSHRRERMALVERHLGPLTRIRALPAASYSASPRPCYSPCATYANYATYSTHTMDTINNDISMRINIDGHNVTNMHIETFAASQPVSPTYGMPFHVRP